MPKEQIHSYQEGQPMLLAGEEPGQFVAGDPFPAFRVEVGWSRQGSVQVATIDPDAVLGTRESGLYVELDRVGINQLIRLLRKARDQAYGRDE